MQPCQSAQDSLTQSSKMKISEPWFFPLDDFQGSCPNFNSNTTASQTTSSRPTWPPNNEWKPTLPNRQTAGTNYEQRPTRTRTTRQTTTPRTPKSPSFRSLAVSLNRTPACRPRRQLPRFNLMARCALGKIDHAVSKWGLPSRAGNGTGASEQDHTKDHPCTRCIRWKMRVRVTT
jgi:hypothetical protein